jgi:hypothetical protein
MYVTRNVEREFDKEQSEHIGINIKEEEEIKEDK